MKYNHNSKNWQIPPNIILADGVSISEVMETLLSEASVRYITSMRFYLSAIIKAYSALLVKTGDN